MRDCSGDRALYGIALTGLNIGEACGPTGQPNDADAGFREKQAPAEPHR